MLPRMTDAPKNPGLIEVKVQTLHQLFNSMDPSPFHERDLDHDAEEFIVSWAQEHHRTTPLKLLVHLGQPPETGDAAKIVTESIHHYFEYKAALSSRELRRLMREGWISLLIGLAFLVVMRHRGEDHRATRGRLEGTHQGRPHHPRLGRHVASAGNLSLPLVAALGSRADLPQAERDAGGSAPARMMRLGFPIEPELVGSRVPVPQL